MEEGVALHAGVAAQSGIEGGVGEEAVAQVVSAVWLGTCGLRRWLISNLHTVRSIAPARWPAVREINQHHHAAAARAAIAPNEL